MPEEVQALLGECLWDRQEWIKKVHLLQTAAHVYLSGDVVEAFGFTVYYNV